MLVNLEAFRETVDLVGGVEFDVPQDMYYQDPTQNLHIDLKAGKQLLDGEKAMELVRFRKGYASQDIQRTKVQQEFLNDMIFRGKVDETEVGRLREGMPVKLTIGALQDVALNAVLEYIAPKGAEENGVIMFEIKASTQIPPDLFVRAGYSANAEIVTDRRAGVLTVPESAVEFEGDKTFVNLLTSDSTATDQTFERKEVKLGLSNGVNVEVTEGLTGNEQIRGTKTTPTK